MKFVGRQFTSDEASSYYPPRARWYGVFFILNHRIQRRLALDRLHMPLGMTAGGLAAGFFVPGLAVYLRGPRLWGQAVLAVCAALLLVYVAWLGHPAANLAFGLLVSVHVTGLVYYCNPLMAQESFRCRLGLTLLVLLALMLTVYWPTRNLVQRHWLTPLRMGAQVIVVRRTPPTHVIRRGEVVAYSLTETSAGEAHNGGAIWAQGGAGLGPVLAVAGDRVTFSTNGYSVNGLRHRSLANMPATGEWVVPEKHWFIWPNLAISGHGNVNQEALQSTLLRLADVAPEQYLGRPFDRWFGRKQTLPASP